MNKSCKYNKVLLILFLFICLGYVRVFNEIYELYLLLGKFLICLYFWLLLLYIMEKNFYCI